MSKKSLDGTGANPQRIYPLRVDKNYSGCDCDFCIFRAKQIFDEFMKRFTLEYKHNHNGESGYWAEWVMRFNTGHPETYMSRKNREEYNVIMIKWGQTPPLSH